jgi:two-component system, chemotaxis family, chemotaxis protein CheY
MRLMIVDDSNLIRGRIARVAGGNHGLPLLKIVALARDGAEAIDQCRRLMPEVATMDLTMPNIDGITCIEELVKLNPQILILVVSALNDKATMLNAMQKGAHGFLPKPFTDEQLVDALRELIGVPA